MKNTAPRPLRTLLLVLMTTLVLVPALTATPAHCQDKLERRKPTEYSGTLQLLETENGKKLLALKSIYIYGDTLELKGLSPTQQERAMQWLGRRVRVEGKPIKTATPTHTNFTLVWSCTSIDCE